MSQVNFHCTIHTSHTVVSHNRTHILAWMPILYQISDSNILQPDVVCYVIFIYHAILFDSIMDTREQ